MKKSDINRFLIKLLYCIPIPVVMILVNCLVDPANIYKGGKYEEEMVKYILEGKNLANVDNFNDRWFQKLYAKKINEKRDVLIFGSSRAMQISSDLFPNQSFFNCSVPNGTLQDYLSIYHVYDERGFKPSMVIIGIDPWIFNRNSSITRWRELESDYFKALEDITGSKSGPRFRRQIIPQKYMMLLSPGYFQRSMRTLLKLTKTKGGKFYPTDAVEADVSIKLIDGSLSVDKIVRDRSVDEIRALAQKKTSDYRLANFNELDPLRKQIFESFIEYLQSNNVTVVLYLPPYHPATYQLNQESSKYQTVDDVEQYIREFASSKNITLIGSYDPSMCLLDESDFFDHSHAKREAVSRLFNDWLNSTKSSDEKH